jgi:hypothetical protein
MPKLPKSISATGVQKNNPWQRRTFSTMLSPLPRPYIDLDSTFIANACCHPVQSQRVLKEFKDWATTTGGGVFDEARKVIPRTRVPCKTEATASRDEAKGGGKSRRIARPSYNVAGLDLTAG